MKVHFTILFVIIGTVIFCFVASWRWYADKEWHQNMALAIGYRETAVKNSATITGIHDTEVQLLNKKIVLEFDNRILKQEKLKPSWSAVAGNEQSALDAAKSDLDKSP